MVKSLIGEYAKRYFDIMNHSRVRPQDFVAIRTVKVNLKKAKEEEDWKRAFLLMELLDDYYDSVCG